MFLFALPLPQGWLDLELPGRDSERNPVFLSSWVLWEGMKKKTPYFCDWAQENLRRPQAAHAQDRPKAAYQSFENGNEIKTTAHRGWDRTCGANLTELTTCYSKLNILQSAQRHTQRKVCPGHNTEVLHTQELGNEITSPRKRFIDTSLDTVQMLECQIRILKQLLWVYSTKQR